MSIILFCFIFSIILANKNHPIGHVGNVQLFKTSLLSTNSEDGITQRLVAPLTSSSVIIVDKGAEHVSPAVASIFGDSFSINVSNKGLSTQEESELNKVISNNCAPEVMSFLLYTMTITYVSLKEHECEIKLLEKKHKRCTSGGALVKRMMNCESVRKKYNMQSRKHREDVLTLKMHAKKVSECIEEITKVRFVGERHHEYSPETTQRECTLSDLFSKTHKLFCYKFFYQIASDALANLSKKSLECQTVRLCRSVSKHYRCIVASTDKLESIVRIFGDNIVGINNSVLECTKYLDSTGMQLRYQAGLVRAEETPGLDILIDADVARSN